MDSFERGHEASLQDYLRVVRRRKWTIVQAIVLVPLAAVLFSVFQDPLFQSSAEVYVNRENLAASLRGGGTQAGLDERAIATEAQLARSPEVAQRTLEAADVGSKSAQGFLAASEVEPKPNVDILLFTVKDAEQGLAVRLATEYARQFAEYRQELVREEIQEALTAAEAELAELKQAQGRNSPEYESLSETVQNLRLFETFEASDPYPIGAATTAEQLQPKPVRNGILGFAFGLILGVGLAFLREALDTRVRSADEIGEALGLPLLARIPEPPRHLRTQDRLAMLDEPDHLHAEPFRLLRANLEFVTADRDMRVIMVTSAVSGEGKSTTVSNLAVSLARAGRRVVLVDLDLRRPLIDHLFALEGRPGLTDVLLGDVSLDDALAPILSPQAHAQHKAPVSVPAPPNGRSALDELGALRASTRGRTRDKAVGENGGSSERPAGVLEVLPSGPAPPTGELLGSELLGVILERLRRRAEIVLIDSAPLLTVGDAVTLSGKVDGLLLVIRRHLLRRPTLTEVTRVLDQIPTPKLGFVEAGAPLDDDAYGYGYGYRAPATKHGDRRAHQEEDVLV